MCGISHQAVYEYKNNHEEQINVLLDKSDNILSLQHKLNTYKASKNLSTCLADATTKKDIIPNVAVIDRLTPAFRLLDGKATEITANMSLIADVNQLLEQLKNGK